MALHKAFPHSPHVMLGSDFAGSADGVLRDTTMDKLTPPLVAELWRRVKNFRASRDELFKNGVLVVRDVEACEDVAGG